MWILLAVLSAVFAGVTSILAKCGIRDTDSDVVTALRTGVVLVFAWIMVFVVGAQGGIRDISPRSFLFLILSGLATGASWLCYFRALSLGDVNKVVPIDKSSTILTVLFAILILGETDNLIVRLGGILLIGIGTFLMIEKKQSSGETQGNSYLIYAVLSAVFAALTSILAKLGIEGVDSNLATAIRTCVVLVMAWGIVFGKKKQGLVKQVGKREMGFIVLSGIATGASWLCYYSAISLGVVSIVVPIDKLSILVSIGFSALVFHEKLTKKAALGLGLIVIGTLGMAVFG
ncbi:MAG: EamA family transporter [Candidatus Limivicinus sp.]